MHYVPGHGWVGMEPSRGLWPSISKEVLISGMVVGGSAIAAAVYFYTTSGSGSRCERRVVGVPGLHNLGNTCYANALLQGLASLPSMSRWLERVNTSDGELHGGFIYELKDILFKLNNCTSDTYTAGGITSSLARHKWNISIGMEHDLYELLNVFVTTWEEELQVTKRRAVEFSLLDFEVSSPCDSPRSAGARRELVFKRCSEIVRMDAGLRSPCFGLTATQLRCCRTECGFRKVRYDVFGVISLSIPKGFMGTHITIEALLRKYFCMEVIRGATCDRCKESSGKSDSGLFKKQGFSKLPQCLIIRVERVGVLPSGNNFKLSDHVEFGETLDVRDLCFYRNKEAEYDRMLSKRSTDLRIPETTSRIVGGAESNAPRTSRTDEGLATGRQYPLIDGGSFVAERREAAKYRYQLRAVSEHRGIPETGHFVTYRRGVNDVHAWYLTNDSSVTRVPYSEVSRAQAYMLYYERIQTNRWFRQSQYNAPLE